MYLLRWIFYRQQIYIMHINFKFDERSIPVNSCGAEPVKLLDNLSQGLYMHEEYNVVILLVLSVHLIFPWVLVSCGQARHWGINMYIVWVVILESEGNQN